MNYLLVSPNFPISQEFFVKGLKEKGINVIVNPDADKSLREPNAFQSIAASLFNDLNNMRRVFNKRSHKLPLLGKVIQRKLTR